MYYRMGEMMNCFIFIVTTVGIVEASHFRGAIISWEPTGNGIEIRVNFRISWRLTYNGFFCNDTIIRSGELIGSGAAGCFSGGCDGLAASLEYRCTDFSPAGEQDWSSGRGSFTFTPTSAFVAFGYSGAAWISLASGSSGSWSLQATADLSPRSDTGKLNTSPTIEISPVVKLQHGCQHEIRLPVGDVDGDAVKCRWASGEKECGDVCNAFPGASLDSETCVITYNADGKEGYYVAAIQVEDFINAYSVQPLSSVPAQFLIYVYGSSAGCQGVPDFVSPTPESDSCHSLNIGDRFEINIVARGKESLRSIVTTSAVGMVRDAPVTSSRNGMYYMSVKVRWTPTPEDGEKDHSLCFAASDIQGLSSETRCIRIPVSVRGPQALTVERLGFTRTWNITFDMEIKPSPELAEIQVFNASDDEMVYMLLTINSTDVTLDPSRRTVTVTLNYLFEIQTQYYVTVSPGLVHGYTGCGDTPSSDISDKTFWIIDINCAKPPPPENGSVSTFVTLNETYAEFSCNKGFVGIGESTLHCLANETWSESDFYCRKRIMPGMRDDCRLTVKYRLCYFSAYSYIFCQICYHDAYVTRTHRR